MFTSRLSRIAITVILLAIGLATASMVRPPAAPAASSKDSYSEQRHGEWTVGHAIDTKTYFPLPPGKQAALASAASVDLDYRRGEWTAGRAGNSAGTYFPLPPGKQTMLANAANAYLEYRRGEWSGR